MKTIQIGFYGLLVLLSAYYTSQSFSFGLWQGFGPGPGLMPLILGISMFVLSLYQLMSTDGVRSKDQSKFLDAVARKRLAVLLLMTILAVLLMEKVGFIPIIILYCFIILAYLDEWKVGKSILFSVGLSVGSWVLFDMIFQLPLPEGLLHLILG